MKYDATVLWLQQRVRTQTILTWLGAVLSLLGGIAILAITCGVVYVVCLICIGTWYDCSHWIYWAIGLAVLPLLFWGNARTSHEYLSDFSFTTGTTSNKVVHFNVPGIGRVSNINPIAPDNVHNYVKMITDNLYGGPRVVLASIGLFRKARRLSNLDVKGCAAVLAVLHSADRGMSFQEIVEAVEGLNPVKVFPQMHDIGGVRLLQREPAGLSLDSDLRREMNEALAAARS